MTARDASREGEGAKEAEPAPPHRADRAAAAHHDAAPAQSPTTPDDRDGPADQADPDEPHDDAARLGGRAVAVVGAVSVVLLACAVFAPLWAPLVLAAWTASLLRPFSERVARLAGDRPVVGAACSVVLVHSLLVPIGVLVAVVGSDAVTFARQLLGSPAARQALEAFVSSSAAAGGAANAAGGEEPSLSALDGAALQAFLQRLPALATEHGATAWRLTTQAAGAGATAVLTVLVFSVALFALLTDGAQLWRWIEAHAPVSRHAARRMARAFHETGRGMIIGAGLTALVQALLATTLYALLGLPRVLVLGALTFVGAFVPAVGTGLVWAPLALGLWLTGQPGKAAILALGGALGIGSIDNVTRPIFQRWGGQLDVPASMLLFSAFGGLSLLGPKGLLLGPLSVRLAREILEIARDARRGN